MKFISILFLSSLTLAYPNGAPGCVVDEQRIMKMGGKNQNLGYTVKPSSNTFSPGQDLTFTVDGPKSYKGLLIYVSSTANVNARVGNFDQLPTGFKSNKDECDQQGYESGPVGAVTHSNVNPKQPGTKLKWVTSAKDKCETVEIHAVVAVDKQVWQILPVVKLSCNGGGGGDSGSNAAAGGDGGVSPSKNYQGEEPSMDKNSNNGGDAPSKKKKNKKKNCKKGKKPKHDDSHGKESANAENAPMKPSNDYQDKEPSSDKMDKGADHGDGQGDDQGDGNAPMKAKKKNCKKGRNPSSNDDYSGSGEGDEQQ